MRSLKTAALAYFADHIDDKLTYEPPHGEQEYTIPIDDVIVYLNGENLPNKAAYKLIAGYDVGSWFVECNIADDDKGTAVVKGAEREAVIRKLSGRAKSVGLLATRATDSAPYDGTTGHDKTKKDGSIETVHEGMYVFMLVQ